jgi:hypothetical protein
MADAQKELKVIINSDTKDAQKDVEGFGSSLKRIGEVAAGLGLERAIEGIIGFGTSFVKSSVDAFNESQKVQAQLDAVLKSTKDTQQATEAHAVTVGLSSKKHAELSEQLKTAQNRLDNLNHTHAKGEDATYKHNKAVSETTAKIAELSSKLNQTSTVMAGGYVPRIQMSRDALIDLSKALQTTTTYSDEAVLSAENLLLTFTNIGKDTFPEATKIVLDMSTALGQDLKSSSIQVGKALQDPILGVTALRRVGVNFNESQTEVIKNLVNTGKSLEAQKLILKELTTEFGGSATAALNTYAGRVAYLKNMYGEIQETVGRFIVDTLTPLAQKMTEIVLWINNAIDKVHSWQEAINELRRALSPQLQQVFDIIIGILAVVFIPLMNDLKKLWHDHHAAIVLIGEVIGGIFLVALVTVIVVLGELLGILVKVIGFLLYVTEAIVKEVSPVFKAFSKLILEHQNTWKDLGDVVMATVHLIVDGVKFMVNGVINQINDMVKAFNSIGSKVGVKVPTLPTFASGGIAPGGLALVGESGPELVNLPQGSQVFSNSESRKIAGNSGSTINISINNPIVREDNDIQKIVDAVKKALGRDNELSRLAAI